MSDTRTPPLLFEQSYKTDDRLLVMIVAATAKAMGLHAFRKSRRRTAPLYVAASTTEELDRFNARVAELYRGLDAEVARLAFDFIAKHTGVDIHTLMR